RDAPERAARARGARPVHRCQRAGPRESPASRCAQLCHRGRGSRSADRAFLPHAPRGRNSAWPGPGVEVRPAAVARGALLRTPRPLDRARTVRSPLSSPADDAGTGGVETGAAGHSGRRRQRRGTTGARMSRVVTLDELDRDGAVVSLDADAAACVAATGLVEVRPRGRGDWTLLPRGNVGAVRVGDVQVQVNPKERVGLSRLLFMLGYARDPGFRPQDVAAVDEADLWAAL